MLRRLPIFLAVALAIGNAGQGWLLKKAWQAEAAAIEACNVRVSESARHAELMTRDALMAAHEREREALAAETIRAEEGIAALRETVGAIGEEHNNAQTRISELLAEQEPEDCANQPVPGDLLIELYYD